MPNWQKSRPACQSGRARTPSEEEAGQAGLEHHPTKEGPTHVTGTLRIEVANLTIGRLCSNKVRGTLESRIVSTIVTSSVQSLDTLVRQPMHFQNLSHITLWFTLQWLLFWVLLLFIFLVD